MARFQKSQLGKKVLFLLLPLLFLVLTPFISTSMRPSYLYFLLNLLIIVLGIEAGFLSAISRPRDERKPVAIVAPTNINEALPKTGMQPAKPVEELAAVDKKKVAVAARVKKMKRCASRPSLFFIGGGDSGEGFKEEEVVEEEEEEEMVGGVEVVGELSKQELFARTEVFIGNFYKQLKMQREESWKKIHGLYHRAF